MSADWCTSASAGEDISLQNFEHFTSVPGREELFSLYKCSWKRRERGGFGGDCEDISLLQPPQSLHSRQYLAEAAKRNYYAFRNLQKKIIVILQTVQKFSFYNDMDSEPSLRWGGYRTQYSIDQEVYCLS